MNDATKIWLLGGLVAAGGIVFGFLAKWFFNQVLSILNDIKSELKSLTNVTTVQDLRIQGLLKENDSHNARLDRHSNRIMDIEKQLLVIRDKIK